MLGGGIRPDGQIPAPLCPLALNAQGNTQNPNSIDNFAIGQHTIRASYGGDASFLPSIARPVSFRITKAATQTALSSTPTTAPKGTQVTAFAAITTNSFGNPPSGTVTFFAGNKPLGPPVAVLGHFDSTTGLAIAEANIITTQLNVGTDTVTAVYSGDQNYNGSTAPGISIIITAK